MRDLRPNRLRAFTLVELLVVIGIIAVLISILIPTLRGARKQAKIVQCTANIQKLIQACQLNAMSHKGFFPLAGKVVSDPAFGNDFVRGIGDPTRTRYAYANWPSSSIKYNVVPLPGALAPHLGVTGLSDDWIELDQQLNDRNGVWKRFICPDTDALERGKYSADPTDANISKQGTMMVCAVGGSEVTAWSTNTDYAFNEGVFGFHYDVRYINRRLRGHTALFNRPSELALFTDANPRAAWSTSFFEPGWITWTPSLTATGPATLGDALAGNGKVDSQDMFDLNRHGKRISIGFADGHVECLTLDKPTLDRVYLVAP